MGESGDLTTRIEAEFSAADQKLKQFKTQGVETFKEREKRLGDFSKLMDELKAIWQPKLELLAKRFGERVQATPNVEPSRREGVFAFKSNFAQIEMRLSVATDTDVTKAIFNYDLRIIPILMEFESHSEIEFPLESVDRKALEKWIDDRIVSFVRTYLSLHENEYYLKGHMVEDPIAHVSFPKEAAGATLEWQGKIYYFLGEETKREFEKKQSAEKPSDAQRKAEKASEPKEKVGKASVAKQKK